MLRMRPHPPRDEKAGALYGRSLWPARFSRLPAGSHFAPFRRSGGRVFPTLLELGVREWGVPTGVPMLATATNLQSCQTTIHRRRETGDMF